jgi:putative SOS response-associated peptidase YedK
VRRSAPMCGRMTQQTRPSEVARIFDAELRESDAAALEALGPRYNVAPTQPLLVVTQRDDGRFVEGHRWGLVPPWAKSVAVGSRMINARAETVATSSAFRASFLRRRCLVPASGFYEWRREGGRRRPQPYLFAPRAGRPLALAGLWAPWRDPQSGDWLLTAAVVTTRANSTVGELHDRMPVLLADDEWPLWLDPMNTDAGLLTDLLQPAPDELLELRPVSRALNSPHNEGPELLASGISPDRAAQATLALFGE